MSFSRSWMGPFSIYEQPKYKPNLTLTLIQTLILILTQILTLNYFFINLACNGVVQFSKYIQQCTTVDKFKFEFKGEVHPKTKFTLNTLPTSK